VLNLTLALLMARLRADHLDAALAANDLAIATNLFNGSLNFHFHFPFLTTMDSAMI
jgi:hypothetical protein